MSASSRFRALRLPGTCIPLLRCHHRWHTAITTAKKKGAGAPAPFGPSSRVASGGLHGILAIVGNCLRGTVADLDATWPQRLGDHTLKADMQQPIAELRTVDHDVVGEHEPALK